MTNRWENWIERESQQWWGTCLVCGYQNYEGRPLTNEDECPECNAYPNIEPENTSNLDLIMKLFWCTIQRFGKENNCLCIANNKQEAIDIVYNREYDCSEDVRVLVSEVDKLMDWGDKSMYKIVLEKE